MSSWDCDAVTGTSSNISSPRAGLWQRLRPWYVLWALLVAWELLARENVIDRLFFPPPSQIVASWSHLVAKGELQPHLTLTLHRTLAAFAAGTLAGLACGFLIGAFSVLHELLDGLIHTLYATPKLTLLPMTMLLLGVNETARVALPALSCFLITAIYGADAVRSINKTYLEIARNYGAGRWMRIRRIYLPATLPQVFTGLRIGFGQVLVLTISVEIVSSERGLGSMIWTAWQTFSLERLYAGVATAAALGLGSLWLFRWLQHRLMPWRRPVEGEDML